MNPTTLRDVLAENAATVEDAAHVGRVDAVRGRIATVRRRRRASVAAVAAAAVVVAGAVVALPHRHHVDPADRPSQMVGHAVPRTTTSLGAQYRYVKGFVGQHGRLTVKLPARSTGYLVRLASAAERGRLDLDLGDGTTVWSTPAGGFGSYYQVAPTDSPTLHLRQRGGAGPVALAVYTLSRPAPGSYVRDGIVYPPTVDDQPLLGAGVADPGAAQLTVPLTNVTGPVTSYLYYRGIPKHDLVTLHYAGEKGYTAEVSMGHEQPSGLAAPDAGGATSVRVHAGTRSATVRVTDRHHRPVTLPGSARIGVGIYQSPDQLQGQPKVIDTQGHRWGLLQVRMGARGQRAMTTTADNRLPILVLYGARARLGSMVRVDTTINGDTQGLIGGGLSSEVVPPEGRSRATISQHVRGQGAARLIVAIYTLADR